MEKKSAEFRGGGWAPFMPNITILIALMLFLEEGEGRWEKRESPSQHCTGFNHWIEPILLLLLANMTSTFFCSSINGLLPASSFLLLRSSTFTSLSNAQSYVYISCVKAETGLIVFYKQSMSVTLTITC